MTTGSPHPSTALVVDIDVRDDLRAGREPLSRIMAAVAELPADAVLHLRAIFEPAPLFKALSKRGFAHESLAHAPDDWSAWFWKPQAEDASDGTTMLLDVRGLEPPEPLTRTLEALESLPAGHELVHINTRVPQLLFPILAERGFACDVDDTDPLRVLVRIWRTR